MSQLPQIAQSIVISQDFPIIQSTDQMSFSNRFSKFVKRISQHEWISEFDLFSIPLQLNFNGAETFKTEFGGLINLLVCISCVLVTIVMQYPHGLVLDDPISQYSVILDTGHTQTVFDYSDTFFELYFYDSSRNVNLVGEQLDFVLQNASIFQIINGTATQLEFSYDCREGSICFRKTDLNQGATLYGTKQQNAFLNFQIATCGIMVYSEKYGYCADFMTPVSIVMVAINFVEQTGTISQKRQRFILSKGINQAINVNRLQYTTNNNILGYIANILSYEIDFYNIITQSFSSNSPIYARNLNCDPWLGDTCTIVQLQCSGLTYIVTQNFDDITAPILFYLSLSQTLAFLLSFMFLKNYSNNCLYLRIADILVFIPKPDGRHHNFKDGFWVFVGCLLHNHPLVVTIDNLLFRIGETSIKKILPNETQLTMDMINYGQACLDEKDFFGSINSSYELENKQPSKIVIDFDQEQEDQQQQSTSQRYFEGDAQQEAFRRMCEENEFFSGNRKEYLSNLLKESEKNYKLVLSAQETFSRYLAQVQLEGLGKEIELPITYLRNDESGQNLRNKKQFN